MEVVVVVNGIGVLVLVPPLCCHGHCCQCGRVINPNGGDGGRAGIVGGGEWGVHPPSLRCPGLGISLGIGLGRPVVGTLGLGRLGLPFYIFIFNFLCAEAGRGTISKIIDNSCPAP